jgi:hypothetical protein
LKCRDDVDVGRECVSKLTALIEVFPWMWGRGSYTWLEEEHLWHFVWQSGVKTYGLKAALEYVRHHLNQARYHISNGHFSPWYTLNVARDGDVSDLMAAIANEIAESENR